MVRGVILEMLSEQGYRTLEAVDGPAGLQILRGDSRIDLLVTDVGLPGMNGRQLADQAREMRPGLKVLFITGYAENVAIADGFLQPGHGDDHQAVRPRQSVAPRPQYGVELGRRARCGTHGTRLYGSRISSAPRRESDAAQHPGNASGMVTLYSLPSRIPDAMRREVPLRRAGTHVARDDKRTHPTKSDQITSYENSSVMMASPIRPNRKH